MGMFHLSVWPQAEKQLKYNFWDSCNPFFALNHRVTFLRASLTNYKNFEKSFQGKALHKSVAKTRIVGY